MMRASLCALLSMLLCACNLVLPRTNIDPPRQPGQILATLAAISPTPTPFQPLPTFTKLAPSETPTPTLLPTSSPGIWHDAGEVVVPIFLYHHLSADSPKNVYTVQVDAFKRQIELLHNLGYTSIPVTRVAEVLLKGAYLPSRPVVITFDDGYRTVYELAFPILKKLGYTATVYMISSYLDKKEYLTTAEAKELIAAGWEFGSHSQTHTDLLRHNDKDSLLFEVTQSKAILEEKLKTEIQSFSYPYGTQNDLVKASVKSSGYLAGVGLGGKSLLKPSSIFYLSRIEIKSQTTFEQFRAFLPWK